MGCTTSAQAMAPTKPIPQIVENGVATIAPSHVETVAPALLVTTPIKVGMQNLAVDDHHEDVEHMMNKAKSHDNSNLDEPKSRTASAASVVSNISTASKGIAYEFKLNDGGGSIVKAHPPKALKRLEMSSEMKLTFEQLNNQLSNAEQRKTKLIAERQERIKTMAGGRAPLRPKTAAAQGTNIDEKAKLEKTLAEAEERKRKLTDDLQKKQQDKDARARRVRERAKNLQNPEFVNKMDTFGPDGNLEAPLSPMPQPKSNIDTFVVETPDHKPEDDFFG